MSKLKCRLCAADAVEVFQATIIERDVHYFDCPRCGLVQTQVPDWLDQAYKYAMYPTYTASIQQNMAIASFVLPYMVAFGGGRGASGVDYGGGTGFLTRFLRDRGADWRWYDTYSDNLYAQGFEADPSQRYDVLTCVECLEHLVDVGDELTRIFAMGRHVIASTTVIPDPLPHPEAWHYYGLQHGQHVAFYRRRTLDFIAKRHGLVCRSYASLHVFSPPSVPRWAVDLVFKARKIGALVSIAALKGRTFSDAADIEQRMVHGKL